MPNPYHDKLGRFATKSGAGGAMSGDAAAKRQAARARTAASVAVLDRSVAEQFDPRAVDSITATYGRLADKYPDVPVRTITVGDAGSMSARCCARFDENGRKVFDIVLDPTMADYTKTVKEFSDSASPANGYHPPCDDAYRGIITHEFGHAVAGAKGDEETLYTRGEKLVTKLFDQHNSAADDFSYYGDEGNWARDYISGYSAPRRNGFGAGRLNISEAFAESFADVEVNGAAAKPACKELHALLVAG